MSTSSTLEEASGACDVHLFHHYEHIYTFKENIHSVVASSCIDPKAPTQGVQVPLTRWLSGVYDSR